MSIKTIESVLSMITVMGLCMTTGCATPIDLPDEAEPQVGEAQEALVATLPCIISSVSPTPFVKLTNNTPYYIWQYGTGIYTVSHAGTSTTYVGAYTNLYLEPGDHVYFNISADPNALNATTCTSHMNFVNDP
ncbi:hypothetical protein A7982_12409 [Minicystis rosea]|nr:hypothetical protein A7982_12409 [Minicystis rosea]